MSKTVRIILGIIIVTALTSLGVWAYWTYLAPEPPVMTPTTGPAQAEPETITISAEGKVAPVQTADLSFSIPGRVAEVLVQKGERATAGQRLALLEDSEQAQAAISAAELELLAAQQALDTLLETADLSAAQAAKDVTDGRDAVHDAETLLEALTTPASEEDIRLAEATVILAEEAIERAERQFKNALRRPVGNPRRAAADILIGILQKKKDLAERRLNYLQDGASDISIAQAQANLDLAKAQLADAERRYEARKSGPDPDEIDLAQSRLSNAAAQLVAAQANLEDLELRAPFDGSIVSINIQAGEYVLPGVPLLTLADLTRWQVETSDLAESDVALIEEGMLTSVEIDAFPGQEFPGKVRTIDYRGQDQRGDVTFTVTIDFDPKDTAVRWGMTAFVDIPIP